MKIPEFLEDYKEDIERYRKEYIQIKTHSLEENQVLDIKQSKFLGKPYLPKNIEYPKDQQGKPMIFLAQINFSEVPKLESYPENGILQLYISSDNWYDCEDTKILFFENLDETDIYDDFTFLTDDLYESSPIYEELALSFEKKDGFGGYEDVRFNLDFEGMPWHEFSEALTSTQKEDFHEMFSGYGNKIGGYAFFTQTDPRSYTYSNANEDVLLLQIDSDEKIMFGDSGVAHIFINKKSLLEKDFTNAYFYWDCC